MSAQYEPELFPGLIYRMKDPKVVLLIFVSGKVVLTGAIPQSCPPIPIFHAPITILASDARVKHTRSMSKKYSCCWLLRKSACRKDSGPWVLWECLPCRSREGTEGLVVTPGRHGMIRDELARSG